MEESRQEVKGVTEKRRQEVRELIGKSIISVNYL